MAKVTTRKPYEFTTPPEPVLEQYIDPDLIPQPLPYDYMPEGYPKIVPEDVIYEFNGTIPEEAFRENDVPGKRTARLNVYPYVALRGEEKYTVTVNGTKYECTAIGYSNDVGSFTDTVVDIGNRGLDNAEEVNSGEPFYMAYFVQRNSDGDIIYTSCDIILGTTPGKTDIKIVHTVEEIVGAFEFPGDGADEEGGYNGDNYGIAELIPGERYKVILDGAEHECTAWCERNYCFVGNGRLWEIPRGEDVPFIAYYEPAAKYSYYQFTTAGDHSLKVIRLPKSYTPMDARFAPGGLVITMDSAFWNGYANMSYAEAYAALMRGVNAIAIQEDSNGIDAFTLDGFTVTYEGIELGFSNSYNGSRRLNFKKDGTIRGIAS